MFLLLALGPVVRSICKLCPDGTAWLAHQFQHAGWEGIVQGNLLEFSWKEFHPFANTLQAIAVGYVVTALLFVYLKTRWQIVAGVAPRRRALLVAVTAGWTEVLHLSTVTL